jgi:pyridinium-3,5-biscarboxylic acid mononucleotide sulfurtransferase
MQRSIMSDKITVLKDGLRNLKSAAVAFSGGVDSTFLLAAAVASGLDCVLAVTVDSAFVAREELRRACRIAASLGVSHQVLEVDVFESPMVVKNASDRCYHCKKTVFSLIRDAAQRAGIAHCLHGENMDDQADFRPGLKAARELGFEAPLKDAGFFKHEIRTWSKQMGLETWDLPSQSCLATRIPFGDPITRQALSCIEQAESFIKSLGFAHVRVRCHGSVARIETDAGSILPMTAMRQQISAGLKTMGFAFVCVDLEGYRTGRMNPGEQDPMRVQTNH